MTKKCVEPRLLKKIETFLRATGMGPTEFGLKCLGDTKFIYTLREGRELRKSTRKRIYDYMASVAAITSTIGPDAGEIDDHIPHDL